MPGARPRRCRVCHNVDPSQAGPDGACGVFVSSTLGSDDNPGTIEHPLRSLEAAFTLALKMSRRVYACAEVFQEQAEIPAGAAVPPGEAAPPRFSPPSPRRRAWAIRAILGPTVSPKSPGVASPGTRGPEAPAGGSVRPSPADCNRESAGRVKGGAAARQAHRPRHARGRGGAWALPAWLRRTCADVCEGPLRGAAGVEPCASHPLRAVLRDA